MALIGGALGGALGGASVSIVIQAIDKYSKELKKADKNFKIFGKTIKLSALQLTALGTAAGVVGNMLFEATKSAIQYERAAQAFNVVAGKQADILLTDLRKAAKGMVSDFKLMETANKALMLGINKNQLPELMEVARVRAKIMGITVTQAFNDINIGIGRQSRLILDNLGFILDMEKAQQKYAKSINKTVDALSDLEKRQAIANDIIEQSQGLMSIMEFKEETTAEKLDRLSAGWDNFKNNLGLGILRVVDASKEFDKLITSLIVTNFNLEKLSKQQQTLSAIEDLATKIGELESEASGLKEQLRQLEASIDSVFKKRVEGEAALTEDIAKKRLEIEQEELKLIQKYGSIADARAAGETENLDELERQLNVLQAQFDVISALRDVSIAHTEVIKEQKNLVETLPGSLKSILEDGQNPWLEAVENTFTEYDNVSESIVAVRDELIKTKDEAKLLADEAERFNNAMQEFKSFKPLNPTTYGSFFKSMGVKLNVFLDGKEQTTISDEVISTA